MTVAVLLGMYLTALCGLSTLAGLTYYTCSCAMCRSYRLMQWAFVLLLPAMDSARSVWPTLAQTTNQSDQRATMVREAPDLIKDKLPRKEMPSDNGISAEYPLPIPTEHLSGNRVPKSQGRCMFQRR